MSLSELDSPSDLAVFTFITQYQQDLKRKRKKCKERFSCIQSGNCTHCGKYIHMDLGKHIAFYHLELAQLWRCPVMWCAVWKGTAHMRRTHKVPLCHGGKRQGVGIWTAGLSVPILGVRRTPVYRWKPGIWLTAPSSSLSGVSGSSGVGPTTGLFTIVLGGRAGKEEAMAAAVNLQRDARVMLSNLQILSQFAMAMNRMSFSMMALGLRRSLFPRAEVDALAPAPCTVRAASYMSATGLWHPQKNPNVPGPVPASSCHSCMNCKYCFPEDRLPPE